MATPLADRLRPRTLDEIVGQRHLLAPGRALRRIIESGVVPNLIFYGPSGVGKTTLASIIANQAGMRLYKLNATTASTADIKAIIDQVGTLGTQGGILLYLDVYNAILSRSTVFEFKTVPAAEIVPAVNRAFEVLRSESAAAIAVDDGVPLAIAQGCGGDVRRAINAVELSVLAAEVESDGTRRITRGTVAQLAQKSAARYDKGGDEHYDIVSAFQKSMRGSDPDAALHYLARLLEADDLPSACRRLMVCACEDVGLAYPMIIPIVKAAVDAALQVGLPEARIPLADAVVLVATAPKSNSAYLGINQATADIQAGRSGPIPRTLQNKHFDGADNDHPGQFYQYAHDFPHHWVKQQYLPDALQNVTYYRFGDNKVEQAAKKYWDEIKK